MHLLRDLLSLFLPSKCILCERYLLDGESSICLSCRSELPLTYHWDREKNYVTALFSSELELSAASSLSYFEHGSTMQHLLHRMKYLGQRKSARVLGEIYGHYLSQSPYYSGIDTIVPVPLHYRRFLKRGYNQSQEFARGIATQLNAHVETRAVRRVVNTSPQVKRINTRDRIENVKDAFEVVNPSRLLGRKVLLVDDVITTGSTMLSCARVMQSASLSSLSIGSISVVRRSSDSNSV